MKKIIKKSLSMIMCFVMVLTMFQTTMFNASAKVIGPDNKTELTITTDKSKYSWGDTITFNITVKNVTDEVLEGIRISSFARNYLKVVQQGDLPVISRLAPGESQTVQIEFYATKMVGFMAIFFPIIWLFSPAARIAYRESDFNYEEKVKIGAFKYKIGFEVEYNVIDEPTSNISLTINQNDFSTTKKDVIISGTYTTDGVLKDITYKIFSYTDTDNASETGSVIIDGDQWEIDLQMKPDVNRIVITGENLDGAICEKTVLVTYDAGNVYTPNEENIKIDEESNTLYVNNMIIIIFKNDISQSRIDEIVRSIDGKIVGKLNGINQYQIEVANKSLQQLKELVSTVEQYSEVLFAHYDEVYEDLSMSVSPNDPWKNDNDNTDWLDNDVDGSNYWLEIIEAPAAWDYNSRFSNIKVGVIDNGFDTGHEDLNIKFPENDYKLLNSKEDHGSHVSGIIGATANNEKGITGIVWNKDLICFDWQPTTLQSLLYKDWSTTTFIYAGLVLNVEAGAKVVNLSAGQAGNRSNPNIKTQNQIDECGRKTSGYMAVLLQDYDFIVVQSAGNAGVDAINNGFFSCITSSNCVTWGTDRSSASNIMKRIFIVAAAERFGTSHRVADFSCGGSQVNIAAPGGEDMYSTVTGGLHGKYDDVNWRGTSMAAPVVTGVCSLVWSINPKFTGAEVADIVLNNTSGLAIDNPNSTRTGGNFPMVNAKLSVEAAIKKTDAFGTVTGTFVDATTGNIINDVTVNLISYNGFGMPSIVENIDYSITSGSFSTKLPAGSYRFKIKADSYIEKYINLIVTADETTSLGNITMSTVLEGQNVRIVLRWGNDHPADLDSHFVGTLSEDGSKYHVYFSSMGQHEKAWLDIDDIDYEGPETITINMSQFSEFTYLVHNYSEKSSTSSSEKALSLATSGATVEVYAGESLIANYSVPTNRKGTVWKVFSMNSDGVINDINSFSYESSTSNVGMQ
ncbi:MAG: S8 family serine peptidase [Acutalibacteraceae bacterium]